MKRYYCNGKKGYCDRGNDNNIDCRNCEFGNGTGGKVVDCPDTMICRDCIYNELCEKLRPIEYCMYRMCSHFKNKANFVELLCKVGDIVYQTDGIRIYELTIMDISLYKNKPYYETEYIDFDEDAIGKSIFLTKEEAEQKLKGGMQE